MGVIVVAGGNYHRHLVLAQFPDSVAERVILQAGVGDVVARISQRHADGSDIVFLTVVDDPL